MHAKKVVFVIAPEQFRDEELFEPKKILQDAGYTTLIASKTKEEAKGKLGALVQPDMTLEEINPEEIDALVFVGGSGSQVYYNDIRALALARQTYDDGKIIAAICAAPPILMNAGLLQGVHCTSHPSQTEYLKERGAIHMGKPVVRENRIITGQNPEAATEFGEVLKAALAS